ncbi:MAG: tetratricopeptide repeat protein [bacterium]
MPQPTRRSLTALCLALALLGGLGGCGSDEERDRGDLLLDEQRPAEAAEAYRQALGERPDDTKLLIRLATAQSRLRRLDDAAATMERAARLQPEDPEVLFNLGLVHLKQERYEEAMESFHRVLEVQPTYPEANFFAGLVHEVQGDEETAVSYYVKEVNHGASTRAWYRLQAYREKQRRLGLVPPGPEPWAVYLFSAVLLGLAALAYGLRLYLARRQPTSPTDSGSSI